MRMDTGRVAKFCWYSMLLSAVRRTSNSPAASASSLPFLMPAQPRRWTVKAECPVSSGPRRPGTDSSSRMRIVHEGYLGVFKNLNCEFSAHRWEVLKEDFERIACFQMLKDDANGYTCPDENRRSTKDLWVGNDARGLHSELLPWLSLPPGGSQECLLLPSVFLADSRVCQGTRAARTRARRVRRSGPRRPRRWGRWLGCRTGRSCADCVAQAGAGAIRPAGNSASRMSLGRAAPDLLLDFAAQSTPSARSGWQLALRRLQDSHAQQ
jgi:hypothetical protein